jgi:hypothetical protein
MHEVFVVGLTVVTGHFPTLSMVGGTAYVDLQLPSQTPYIRLTRTATGFTITLSTGQLLVSTTSVPVRPFAHPDGVASALTGLVYRSQTPFVVGDASPPLDLSVWPPGRVTSFALMLVVQTHPAPESSFHRASLTPSSSVWVRADGARTISTIYKEDYVELADTCEHTTKVLLYPTGLSLTNGKWTSDCPNQLILVLRSIWHHLSMCSTLAK